MLKFEILKAIFFFHYRWKLYPRVLRNAAHIDLSTTVLGQRVSMPICAGATAMQCMAHEDGELATVRGKSQVLTFLPRCPSHWATTRMLGPQAPLWETGSNPWHSGVVGIRS